MITILNVGGRWKAGQLVEARMLHIAFFIYPEYPTGTISKNQNQGLEESFLSAPNFHFRAQTHGLRVDFDNLT
jgi:hypothetical protein